MSASAPISYERLLRCQALIRHFFPHDASVFVDQRLREALKRHGMDEIALWNALAAIIDTSPIPASPYPDDEAYIVPASAVSAREAASGKN